MRTPTALPPIALPAIALLTAALTGCSPLLVELPQGAAEPDQSRFEYPPSELSPEEPLLCLDGERDGADCTAPGTLRWSVPLDGDHYVGFGSEHVLFDTRSRLSGRELPRGLVAEGDLHHFADDLLRVHDVGTGEHLWTADLRAGAPKEVGGVLRTEHRVFVGLGDGRRNAEWFDELVVLDAGDGTEAARLHPAEAFEGLSSALLLGVAADGETVVLRHSEDGYLGADPVSGAELWRVEAETVLEPDDFHRRTHRFEDGAFDVITWTRDDTDSDWEVAAAQRFDTITGSELGEPDVEGEKYSWESGFRPEEYYRAYPFEELPYGERAVPRLTPSSDIDPGRWEALSGTGMGTLLSWDEESAEVVGVACAPDAMRDESPSPVPGAVRCDNARLFVVNP